MLIPTLLPALFLALSASAVPASAEQLTFARPASAAPFRPDIYPGHTLHKLNDGRYLPSPAFGVGSVWHDDDHRQLVTEAVLSALEVGYRHIDNSAIYGTEQYVGEAIAQWGGDRAELFITTKFDNFYHNESSVERTFQASLRKLGVDYVDLLLIHFPQFARPVAPVWREFEGLVRRGLVKSIGVSNYNQTDLQEILDLPGLEVRPAVNQIRYHPYNTDEQNPTVEFNIKHGIVTQAYSALTPLTKEPEGPVTAVVESIADQVGITDAQVLLDWVKGKGLASVTTSGNRGRQADQLAVAGADFPKLTLRQLADIDAAGLAWERSH